MTGNSDSLIILPPNLVETATPSIMPFHPRSLFEIVNEAVFGGYIRGCTSKTENFIFEATSLKALGEMLAESVDKYFQQTSICTDIPAIPFSAAFNPKTVEEVDTKIEAVYKSLGNAERAYIEDTAEKIHDEFKERRNDSISDVRYAFNLTAGQHYMNVMARLVLSESDNKKIYEQFMQDALSHKIAGHILQKAAFFFDEGVTLSGHETSLTWKNLCREVAPRLDLRYLTLKI